MTSKMYQVPTPPVEKTPIAISVERMSSPNTSRSHSSQLMRLKSRSRFDQLSHQSTPKIYTKSALSGTNKVLELRSSRVLDAVAGT